jgi:hypothetical protein
MQVSRGDAERSGLRVGAGLYVGSGSIQRGDRVLLLVLQTSAFLATPAAFVCSEFRRGIQLPLGKENVGRLALGASLDSGIDVGDRESSCCAAAAGRRTSVRCRMRAVFLIRWGKQ